MGTGKGWLFPVFLASFLEQKGSRKKMGKVSPKERVGMDRNVPGRR